MNVEPQPGPPDHPNVCVAVVVLYHPVRERLAQALRALSNQVAAVVVYDNTTERFASQRPLNEPELQSLLGSGCRLTLLGAGHNMGLAAGLNRGIQCALDTGATHVLLLDQDSVAAPGMVAALLEGSQVAQTHGLRVAAAGPSFSDTRGVVPPPFLRVGFPTCRAVYPQPGDVYVRTDVLITSGSLLGAQAIRDIGPMAESLFIDNVDIEWGFRAKAAGWALIGVPAALLNHQLGEQRMPAPWWLRWTGRAHLIHHPPVRLYYIMRNRLALQRLPHVPLAWKLQDLLRLPWRFLLGLQSAKSKPEAFRAMAQGLWHAVIGRSGPRP